MYRFVLKSIHLCQRLRVQICRFPKYVNNFGFKVAIYIMMDRLFPPGRSKRYQQIVYEYLNSCFADIAKTCYKVSANNNTAARIVWICWFQGEDAMPELVKMCYSNLCKKLPVDIEPILLTYRNIDQYVEIPGHIREKYQKGIISNAHYSDILRFKLLRKYGGCWMDATIFVTDYIKDELFDRKFYTLKMRPELCPKEPCGGLWSGFFLIGQKELALFNILDDCLCRYWKIHDEVIDYIFFDYLMLVAYRNNNEVKNIIDSVPYNNEELWYLWNNIEKPFDEASFSRICDKGQFYKLSYQKKIEKQVNGKKTVYGYLTSKH